MPQRRPRIVLPDTSEANLATLRANGDWARLEAAGEVQSHLGPAPDEAAFAERVAAADAVLLGWDFPTSAFAMARNLRVISFAGAGVGSYVDLDAAAAHGVVVRAVRGYGDVTVAEHALALTLAVLRHLPAAHATMAEGGWTFAAQGRELSGATVGIVGWGGIARAFARLLTGFATTNLVWTRQPPVAAQDVRFVALEELAARADILSLHLASTPATRGIVSRELLQRLPTGAVLVNTARGDLVDETALLDALRSGRLAGAGLDVFAHEPLPPDSPLRHAPNVVLTPHVAYRTPEARARLLRRTVDQLLSALSLHF